MATVNPTAASNIPASLTSSTSATPKNGAQQQQTQFLQLLVAQLQGQNPLDPKDGTEFVSQLAQFSSLEELVKIRTALETLTKPSTDTNPTSNTNPASSPNTTTDTSTTSNPFKGA
jgi:flagellar basal-body rod modification protein FlgD